MYKSFLIFVMIILSLNLNMAAYAQATKCELDNEALQAMTLTDVTFTREDNSTFVVKARVAETDKTRSAGFQHVCASVIEEMPILFLFHREVIPSFHMNNVVAPIDIAFIDKRGRIDSLHAMKPYVLISKHKPLYSPMGPIIAALEASPGFFTKNKLEKTSLIRW